MKILITIYVQPRTSRQETEEVSTAIQQQAEVLEQRKEKRHSRQVRIINNYHSNCASTVERMAEI